MLAHRGSSSLRRLNRIWITGIPRDAQWFFPHMSAKEGRGPLRGLTTKPSYSLDCAVSFHSSKRPSPSAPSPDILTGEDAYAIADFASHTLLTVADGVGGWAQSGVDPSEFSWALVKACAAVAESTPVVHHFPQAILDRAYSKVCTDGEVSLPLTPAGYKVDIEYTCGTAAAQVKAGSSTAAVVTLNRHTGLLETANLGDSWIGVIRQGQYVLQTTEQQHFFNCPYQLSVLPNGDKTYIEDHPDMAECQALQAEDGDYIILATDGYSDNVFPSTTLNLLDGHTSTGPASAEESLAALLLSAARDRAQSAHAVTPFSKNAAKHGYRHNGGKIDDVTIIIGRVRATGPPIIPGSHL